MEGVLTAADPRLTGRLLACGRDAAPLLVCVHGGGCHAGYFDMPGFSVARTAQAAGFDVLLVDRPGYGDSAPPRTAEPIREAAALIAEQIKPVLRERGDPGVALIGHSIGGAVALTIAAEAQVPVAAVAVSGIGRTPSAPALAWLAERAAADPEPLPEFFFGPEGSYDWRGPMALRKAVAPWRLDEVVEVMRNWPARFDAVAAAIAAPVGFHLAQHERIWRAEPADVADAATRFTLAARVEAGVLPEGGHLYEIHKRGPEQTAAQLRFLAAAMADARSSIAAHA